MSIHERALLDIVLIVWVTVLIGAVVVAWELWRSKK